MNDLKNSIIEEIIKYKDELKMINEDITKMINYKKTVETTIIDWCNFYQISNDELEGVKVKNVSTPKRIPLNAILDVFPDTDIKPIIENIVAKIDIDLKMTEENLRYSGKFQDPTINSIIKQLSKLSKETIQEVEI